jgi:hypothetical protein
VFKDIKHFSMGTLDYFKDEGDQRETRYVAMFPHLYKQTTRSGEVNDLVAEKIQVKLGYFK